MIWTLIFLFSPILSLILSIIALSMSKRTESRTTHVERENLIMRRQINQMQEQLQSREAQTVEITEQPSSEKPKTPEATIPTRLPYLTPPSDHPAAVPYIQQPVSTPIIPQPTVQFQEDAKRRKGGSTLTENMIGRTVLGVAASILVFVGLIELGLLIYEHLTDDMKIILMFLISALITGLGVVLSIKAKNAFTVILTSCGCGSFFISIMLTHLYFERFQDLIAFLLLLAWMSAALFLAKKLQSTTISIVTHIGMILSICIAYAMSLSDDKLLILLIYQMMSIAVIVVGNILCSKKTYHFGLFVSLVLTLIASAFMWARFPMSADLLYSGQTITEFTPFTNTLLPVGVISIAFVAQFICASFLSYLLSVSANRLKSNWTGMIHVANKIIWTVAYFIIVHTLSIRLICYFITLTNPNGASYLSCMIASAVIGVLIAVLHAALTISMRSKLHFRSELETISVLTLGVMTGVLMLLVWHSQMISRTSSYPLFLLMLIPAGLLATASLISRNRAYTIAAYLFYGIDFFYMLFCGYIEIVDQKGLAPALLYMLIYPAALWVPWLIYKEKIKDLYGRVVRMASYLMSELSLIVILLRYNHPYGGVSLLLVLSTLILLLLIFRYDGPADRRDKSLFWTMRVNQWLLLCINALTIAYAQKTNAALLTLYTTLTILSFILLLVRIRENLMPGSIRYGEEALYMILAAALSMSVVYDRVKNTDYASVILLLSITVISIALHTGRYYLYRSQGQSFLQSPVDMWMQLNELVWFVWDALYIAFSQKNELSKTLCLLLTAMALLLAMIRVDQLFRAKMSAWAETLSGVKLTALSLACVYGLTNWFDNSYVFSLICMLTAMISVIVGFVCRGERIRLYGLILTLLCVLKLVTYDVIGLSTYLRVISFICGGVICFVISAIYSYSVKKLNTALTPK